jgi:hypothetical protein
MIIRSRLSIESGLQFTRCLNLRGGLSFIVEASFKLLITANQTLPNIFSTNRVRALIAAKMIRGVKVAIVCDKRGTSTTISVPSILNVTKLVNEANEA